VVATRSIVDLVVSTGSSAVGHTVSAVVEMTEASARSAVAGQVGSSYSGVAAAKLKGALPITRHDKNPGIQSKHRGEMLKSGAEEGTLRPRLRCPSRLLRS
jgi:hypothetical protein